MTEQIGDETGCPTKKQQLLPDLRVRPSMPRLHGTAPVLDSAEEEYGEHLDSDFLANDIADPVKKQAILVNAVGPKTYRLIKTLCLSRKPQDHSFEEIVKRALPSKTFIYY